MPEDDTISVLLVDDNPANLLTLKAVLHPLGLKLVTAHSGSEALKYLLLQDFAVILLDVQMPGMDGFETAERMKKREKSRHIPIIFLTALADDARYLEQAYSAGAVDYLQKPFNSAILQSKVRVFVSLYQQREEIRRQSELLNESIQRESALRQQMRESELAEIHAHKVAEMSRRQRVFLREVLFSLSEGRLHLCDSPDDLPVPFPPRGPAIPMTKSNLRAVRGQVVSACTELGWMRERIQDLETAVGEAAMNAVVHGRGASSRIHSDSQTSSLQVWIRDEGAGIAEESLHRATLERGFTTAGTLGHGFWIILKTCDRVYLLTGSSGTTIVLEMEQIHSAPDWVKKTADSTLA